MKVLLALLIVLFTGISARAQDYWGFRKGTLTVKITSAFKSNPELKLEGSGLIYREGGTFYVLTSEHVVLPSNDLAIHHVENKENDFSSDAVYVQSDWSMGLAVLRLTKPKIGNHWVDAYPTVEELRPTYYPDPRAGQKVTGYGFPAGTDELRTSEGTFDGRLAEGEVLALQKVLQAHDLQTEFGMSGGPVFADDRLLGIMTHVKFENQWLTYVIPIWDAFEWVRVKGGAGFTRSFEDFQTQFFSKEKVEVVHYGGLHMKIERRDGKILVTVPPGGSTRYDTYSTYRRGLINLPAAMAGQHVHVAAMESVAGRTVDKNTTLQQFVGALLGTNEVPDFTDYEATLERQDPNYVSERNFEATAQSFARYDVTIVDDPLTKVWDPSYTTMSWVRKKAVRQGNISYVIDWCDGENMYERRTWFPNEIQRTEQQRSREDFFSTERWRTKLANCARTGGTVEKIGTHAGTYRTCKVREGDRTVWYGPVPVFGIVKVEEDGGTKWELAGVGFGQ